MSDSARAEHVTDVFYGILSGRSIVEMSSLAVSILSRAACVAR